MDRHLAIVNPAAGGGRCGRLAGAAIADLREQGVELDVWYTRRAGHGTELAQRGLEHGYRSFVAVGGDGTVHEIVNGVSAAFGTPSDRVSLGFLPLGTGNSFIRDYTVNGSVDAVAALRDGRKRACDVMRLRHDDGELYWINIFSYGFVAKVCALANDRFKRLGSAGYALGVVAELATLEFESVRLRLDRGRPWEQQAAFVSINNSQYTGGNMHMSPYASAEDGLADVLVVGRIGRPTFMALFAKIFSGGHVHHPAVTTSRASTIDFQFDGAIPAMVDGEVLHLRPHELTVLPGVLDVRI